MATWYEIQARVLRLSNNPVSRTTYNQSRIWGTLRLPSYVADSEKALDIRVNYE